MHRIHRRLVLVGLLAVLPAMLAAASLGATGAGAQASTSGQSLPIFGMISGGATNGATFEGTVSQLDATDQNGLTLGGVLNGLAQIGKDTVRIDNQKFSSAVKPSVAGSIPAADYHPGANTQATPAAQTSSTGGASFVLLAANAQTASCDVLFLDIKPIHLDLLGLDLQTSRITIDLKAIPGPGNLLGNLVCGLAHLLDGTPNAIGQITNQLNQVLSGAGVASAAATANQTAVATQVPTNASGNATGTTTTNLPTTVPGAATPIG